MPTSITPSLVGSSVVLDARTVVADTTLVVGDAGKIVEANSADLVQVTVPPNSEVAFALGTIVEVDKIGAGDVNVLRGAGVSFTDSADDFSLAADAVSLRKRATNEWFVVGQRAAAIPTGFDPTALGTVPTWLRDVAVGDGTVMSTWTAEHGDSPTSSGSARPVWHTNVLDGLGAATFDADAWMQFADQLINGGVYSLFAVVEKTAAPVGIGAGGVILGNDQFAGGDADGASDWGAWSSTQTLVQDGHNTSVWDGATFDTGGWHLHSLIHGASADHAYCDGVALTGGSHTANIITVGGAKAILGAVLFGGSAPQSFWAGKMAEILAIKAEVSVADVHPYFAARYPSLGM